MEISKFEIEGLANYLDPSAKLEWRTATKDEVEALDSWAESLYEEMLREAREQEQAEIDAAKELAAETKEDLRRMGP